MVVASLNTPPRTKPKPPLKTKGKKRGHIRGVCPQCGFIWETQPAHFPHCQKELDQIRFMSKPYKTKTQIYKMALDRLCQLITEWRDGCKCVLEESDGVRCGNVSQWGHVIPQNSGSFLVYELSNSFRQCNSHNMIHDKRNPDIYFSWYAAKWGHKAKDMLNQAWKENIGVDWSDVDYWNKLIELSDLYEMRYSFGTATLEEKVEAGFYGSIIREAWIKDGRI